ncbi:hypothetical protein [Bauldia sp.]|uniref:hypothetical protein n=1 Tax=Bauldia sp. TaxID=2575872 RepID=UPI003BAA0402
MTTTTRKLFVAAAFVVTAAAGITGATLSGETKETDLAAYCETAAWPQIPAACLDGGTGADVRYISADPVIEQEPLMQTVAILAADRFSTAY